MITDQPTYPERTIFDVINAIMNAVGGWGLSGALQHELAQLICRRLGNIRAHFQRFQAGKLWRRRPREATPAVVEADPAEAEGGVEEPAIRSAAAKLWPSRFGWLLKRMGYQTQPFRQWWEEVLKLPEVVAYLAASPQAARKMRPICRAFGISSEELGLPRKIRVPRPRKPRQPRYIDIPLRKPGAPGPRWVFRCYRWRGPRYVKLKD